MNKSELITALSARVGTTKSKASEIVEALFNPEEGIIATTLNEGGEVSLQGFGKWHIRSRAARVARNPHTGEPIDVPARRVVAFKPGAGFK